MLKNGYIIGRKSNASWSKMMAATQSGEKYTDHTNKFFCLKRNKFFFFFTTLHYRRTDLVGCCGLRFGRSTGTLPDTVGRCACNARPICAMRCTLWARYTVWDVPFTRKQVVKVVDLSQQVPPKGTYRIIASEGFEAFDPIQRSRVAHPLDGLPVGD